MVKRTSAGGSMIFIYAEQFSSLSFPIRDQSGLWTSCGCGNIISSMRPASAGVFARGYRRHRKSISRSCALPAVRAYPAFLTRRVGEIGRQAKLKM